MQLPVSSSLCSSLLYLESAESTNSFLMAEASDKSAWPDFSVVVTDNQTAGRGRSGREWVSAPGAGLAVSILLRPQRFRLERFSWLPLMAGAAMTQAVRTLLRVVGMKNNSRVNLKINEPAGAPPREAKASKTVDEAMADLKI